MPDTILDRLYIRDLLVRCIVGIFPEERWKKQDVLINITLYADLREACRSDRIEDSVDYKSIKDKVFMMVEHSSYRLLERLAERIADICLEDPKVRRVHVSVQKPGALRNARCPEVEIVRDRPTADSKKTAAPPTKQSK
jgi:D-erythro-7,8-dihydroneopterin triphosphate epimerase